MTKSPEAIREFKHSWLLSSLVSSTKVVESVSVRFITNPTSLECAEVKGSLPILKKIFCYFKILLFSRITLKSEIVISKCPPASKPKFSIKKRFLLSFLIFKSCIKQFVLNTIDNKSTNIALLRTIFNFCFLF